MLVLGIETTCDETSCAIVKDGSTILSVVTASQYDVHTPFQGVVPELACRRHVEVVIPVLQDALTQGNLQLNEIDLIAVASGPGLVGALLIGLNAAKALSLATQIPFVGVNHVEAHLYAAMMGHLETLELPALGVVVSGGHTALCLIKELGRYELIGCTVDDAIGEAFDKVSVLLGMSYPGGPQIEALAKSGDRQRYPLKAGQVKGRPLDFSFSGLKTAVLYTTHGQDGRSLAHLSPQERADLAASFQEAALQDVVRKTLLACQQLGARSIVLGGGVTCNQRLRELLHDQAGTLPIYWPAAGLSTDNAAMIAGLGYHLFQAHPTSASLSLEASPLMPWSNTDQNE
ncbi:MAG: tRNA (adenosine(37)-N6)-threonylcarbamoyltransferase complex transferase subunit TsaD [Chlamydiia bacterium]